MRIREAVFYLPGVDQTLAFAPGQIEAIEAIAASQAVCPEKSGYVCRRKTGGFVQSLACEIINLRVPGEPFSRDWFALGPDWFESRPVRLTPKNGSHVLFGPALKKGRHT